MINRKTPDELAVMTEGGRKLAQIRDALMDFAREGVTLTAIDAKASELIAASGGEASFKTVDGYSWATCLCVNDVVVHGIPTSYPLRPGDLLTVDVGLLFKGFHTDTAWTKTVGLGTGTVPPDLHAHFRSSGEKALVRAVGVARAGNRIADISRAIQETVEGAGYHVIRSLVGHGVGRALHEEPQIPGYLQGDARKSPVLTDGMVIAIEVIYAEGGSAVVYKNDDGWSISTRDGSLSAVYEQTVAVTANGPVILTSPR